MSEGRIAGIDFGTVRLGIAITDVRKQIVSPYENYRRRGPEADARRLRQLAEDEAVAQFVVGLPVHMSGDDSEMSRQARAFGQWLQTSTGVPVELFDERYTTAEADELLQKSEFSKTQRKERRDMLAAQIMLTAYLESRCHDEPESLD